MHCHLVLDSKMDPSILLTLLQHRWQALHFSSKSQGVQWKNISYLLFEFIKCSWFWLEDHVRTNHTKINYREAIFLVLDVQYIDQLNFCEATCGQKLEHRRDQTCLTVPLRSSVQEDIVEHIQLALGVHCLSYLLYNHPVHKLSVHKTP